jgi:hypothetical protein
MPASEFKFGIEIEAIYNRDILPMLRIGQYHRGARNPQLKGFSIQSDGSLNSMSEFPRNNCAEFVTDVRRTKKGFFQQLHRFKDYMSRDGKYELKDVVSFNQTCGCHVHVSLVNGKRFYEMFTIEEFFQVRRYFFNQLQRDKVIGSDAKRLIRSHYNREYARVLKRRTSWRHTRSSEFNVYSERDGRGIEWRGFNLRGITTWVEFLKIFEIVWNTMEYMNTLSKTDKLKKVVIL